VATELQNGFCAIVKTIDGLLGSYIPAIFPIWWSESPVSSRHLEFKVKETSQNIVVVVITMLAPENMGNFVFI